MKKIIFILLISFIFTSCQKDEIGPQCISCDENLFDGNTASSDVLIINEGTFNFDNASISLYNKATHQVSENLFSNQNNQSLGDVTQSFYQLNGLGYIVVNNSSKIEVVSLNDFKSVSTITGFTSPRYFLPVGNNKAYVTDLFSNSIQIVNLNSKTITGSIGLNGWTEELILHNDTVYACDVTNDNLLIINPQNNKLIDSVKVGVQPQSIVKDQNNKIWIMCDGGINEAKPTLIQFNPQTRTIEQTFTFSSIAESPSNLKINKDGNTLYFLNNGVYQFNISSNNLPTSPVIPSNGNIYYGLGIDPTNNDIYIADAIDYVQKGIVFRYNSAGNLIQQFKAGIIPNGFVFID